MMTLRNALAFAMVVVGSFATIGSADGKSVKLVSGNGYAPYADSDVPNGGMTTAIVRAAYEMIPTELKGIEFTDWRRGYRAVKKGEYTATFPYIKNEKRKGEMYFSDPIYTVKLFPTFYKDVAYEVKGPEDLHGLTYCMQEDYSPGTRIEAMEEAGKLDSERPYRMIDCVRMLKRGRVDFIPGEKPFMMDAAEEALGSANAVRFEDLVLQTTPLYVIFPKNVEGAKQAMRRFNKAMRKLRQSGKWQDIVDRYMD